MRVGLCLLWSNSHAPLEDHPLDTHHEPSAPYCWILEILYCNPKGRRALLRIPTTVVWPTSGGKGDSSVFQVGNPKNVSF